MSTKDVYVEKNFYGQEGLASTDEIIKDLELEKFSPLCIELREAEGNVTDYSQQIAEFVANTSMRISS